MKKQYIKQVKRKLSVSRRAKKEIVRDLEEVFASALEHGENEKQVMERLGSPRDFAENMQEQRGFDWIGYRNRNKVIQIIGNFATALTFFVIYIVVKALQIPKNVIGQADSMTGIKIEAPFVLNSLSFIVILGMVALIVAIVLTIKYIYAKHYEYKKEK